MSEYEHEIRAATVIQTHFRGYLARKQYSKKLLALFEEEEEKRREKIMVQVLEGEMLLEKHRFCNSIAENITLNHNEERLMNMMATRIQQAWKKYRDNKKVYSQERPQAHPQLTGRAHNTMFGENKALLNEEQFKTAACDMYTHEQSRAHVHHLDHSDPSSNDVEVLTSQPAPTISQDIMPTNKFEVSADPPYSKALTSSGPQSQNSEYTAFTEQTELGKDTLKSTSIHPMQNSSLESSFRSTAQLSTSVRLLDENAHILNKERVTSPGDRYRLCYTIELSDSSTDEDKNWLEGSEKVTVPSMECFNDDCHHELEDFVCDDDLIHQHMIDTPPEGVGNHGRVSPNKRRQLDHSTSPLYAMNLQQLRQLFLSLEQKLSDHSRTLIELLEERDWLKNEKELLQTNIAHLARSAQSLYTAT